MLKKICFITIAICSPMMAQEIVEKQTTVNLYTEKRPWGSFTILDEGTNFKVKRIVVMPNMRLSLQTHNFRSEHWVIVQGQGVATIGEELREVKVDDQIYIAIKQMHRIHNTGNEPLVFIETQSGEYLGEDDIVRYSDDFNRV